MTSPSPLRVGVIGAGNIGQTYIQLLRDGVIQRATLGAVAARRSVSVPDGVPVYTDYQELLAAGAVDAVLVATPTMLHTEMALAAGQQRVHALIEKPLAMSIGQAQQIAEAQPSDVLCAVMLNQRFHPAYAKLYELLQAQTIGEIRRVSWMMTAWYRPDIYYQVSSWRGTWPGEGGGLLVNQCIHNLDVLQWLVGLPSQVSAIAGFGKHHSIDVEDEFTATLSFENGATGVVVASSGEAPGINQLDIVGDLGTLRFDGTTIKLLRADQSISAHCAETTEMFGSPGFVEETVSLTAPANAGQHAQVIQNFVDAIVGEVALATPAAEGFGSLQLANAILMSAWNQQPVALPVDAIAYEEALQQRISASTLRTPTKREAQIDMNKSFR